MKQTIANATTCSVTYQYNIDNEKFSWGGPDSIRLRNIVADRPVGDAADPSVVVARLLGVDASRLRHVNITDIRTVIGSYERCIRVSIHRRFSADGSAIVYQKVQYSRTPFTVESSSNASYYSGIVPGYRTSFQPRVYTYYKRKDNGSSLCAFETRMDKLRIDKEIGDELKAHGYIQLQEGESVRAAAERGLKEFFNEYAAMLKVKQTTIENNNDNWENIK